MFFVIEGKGEREKGRIIFVGAHSVNGNMQKGLSERQPLRYFIFDLLISLAPVNHVLCRLSTAYADIAEMLLLEWDTS